MRYRIFTLALTVACLLLVSQISPGGAAAPSSPALVLGFLLLTAFCVGALGERIGLPRITGYILAGLLLGPHALALFDQRAVESLLFLNHIALAFIAFCAGGELKLEQIRHRLRALATILAGITVVVFLGVTLAVFIISPMMPFLEEQSAAVRLAVAAIFGVIATARSPSSAIAVIREVKARGPFTDTVLSVTVAMDMVVILLFAVVMAVGQATLTPGNPLDLGFGLHLGLELLASVLLGVLLGKAVAYLVQRLEVELPIVMAAMGFVVLRFCHLLGDYLHLAHDVRLNIEPLIICMTAGFVVQNMSGQGEAFLRSMDRISLPIYVTFFAITGATMNIEVLRDGWHLGLAIVITRLAMLYVGSFLSGKLAGEPPVIYRNAWLGFVTQAGVSLGLIAEVVRRFPRVGVPVQTILIAGITLNQMAGPVLFKYVLSRVGEARVTAGQKPKQRTDHAHH